MTEKSQIYKCGVCGNVVEVLFAGGGELSCCGKPMLLMKENTVDAAKEKHVPVIERKENGFKVTVGAVAHPMEEKHYIQWIELIIHGRSHRKFLKPGDKPEAMFVFCADCCKTDDVVAREYCNLHGLWKSGLKK